MARNKIVKENVNEMLFKIFEYIAASDVSEDEYTLLSLECATSCIVNTVSFDHELSDESIKEGKRQIKKYLLFLMDQIDMNLDDYIKSNNNRVIKIKKGKKC